MAIDNLLILDHCGPLISDIEKDIGPYLELMKNNLTGIMTAHIVFPSIDCNIATFSKKWLNEILKQKYSYEGFIFSDDLTMKSAAETGPMPHRIPTIQA